MKKVIFGHQPENFEEETKKALKRAGVSKQKYKTCSLDRVREALNLQLGEQNEVKISQQKVRQGIKMSDPTWFKCLSELRDVEFEITPIQRGTLIRRIKF